jgi:hypothetical protein
MPSQNRIAHIVGNTFVIMLVMTLLVSSLILSPTRPSQAAFGDRITISGGQFMAGGARIWINGANTPWDNWNDFGGSYDAAFWDSHFLALHNAGINATRVWILCDGLVGVNISSGGVVSGATAQHWSNLDSLFQIAANRQIYIKATLMSFDNFKSDKPANWRNWLNSDSNIDSYVNNYLIPFVNRYETNPWLWSIDLMNEPDWVYSGEGGCCSWDRLQAYFARAARAIHENSPILVTVGMGMPKYMSTAWNGNFISNSALQAKVNDPDVYLDFWSEHYYPWMDSSFGNPFDRTPAQYGLDTSKLAILGESPAKNVPGHTMQQAFEDAYNLGWQGVMPWTSNGVDTLGTLADDIDGGSVPFKNNHTNLVFPPGTSPTNTPTRTNTPVSPTATPTTAPGTTTVDDSVQGTGQNQFNYVGTGWSHCTNCNEGGSAIYYNSSQSWNNVTNSYVTIAFTGTQIKYYAVKAPDVGIAAVSIDGGAETNIDLYMTPKTGNVLVWTSPALTNSSHTFKVRNTGTKNASSSGTTITLDRVDIISGGATATPTRTNTPIGPTNTPTNTPSSNLLTNPGFESGTTGWSCNGCTGSTITSPVFAGSQAYQAAARTATWAGPLQDVTSKVTNGQVRNSEVWVRLPSGTATVNVTLELNTSAGMSWISMTPNVAVNSTGWTKVSGSATVSWSGTLNTAKWFVQTTTGTTTFYIDDAKMTN